MGVGIVANSVVELGHIARPARQFTNQRTKPFKAAALLGNRHSKQCFPFFTDFGSLGNKAQAVKVHVGTAQNGGVSLAFGLVRCHILLDSRYRQRTGGLHNAARVYKHILDGRADCIGIYCHEFIDQITADAESLFAHQFDGRAIRKQTHIVQSDAFFGGD